MKIIFRTTVREIIYDNTHKFVQIKCGQRNVEKDDFEITLRLTPEQYKEFLADSTWPDPKDHLNINLEMEQVG